MPRRQRVYVPDVPTHVVQRGNNKQRVFLDNSDCAYYMSLLSEAIERYEVALNAYVLMGNHVHFLMTPSTKIGISRVMQLMGKKYVYYFNQKYERTGALWGGRHFASLIDSELYLLNCYRYIELNPVRANIVGNPANYTWSSYHANALGKEIKCITPHEKYLALGKSQETRLNNYKALFTEGLSSEEIKKFTLFTKHNYPIGSDDFIARISAKLGIKFGKLTPGAPKKLKK
ncbi:transposase [Glaciecola sp. 1036]|uniref:transposase n=1 Tax=Alteromonadaceae TaxID=72275 RepID=UPI003CFED49F